MMTAEFKAWRARFQILLGRHFARRVASRRRWAKLGAHVGEADAFECLHPRLQGTLHFFR